MSNTAANVRVAVQLTPKSEEGLRMLANDGSWRAVASLAELRSARITVSLRSTGAGASATDGVLT